MISPSTTLAFKKHRGQVVAADPLYTPFTQRHNKFLLLLSDNGDKGGGKGKGGEEKKKKTTNRQGTAVSRHTNKTNKRYASSSRFNFHRTPPRPKVPTSTTQRSSPPQTKLIKRRLLYAHHTPPRLPLSRPVPTRRSPEWAVCRTR